MKKILLFATMLLLPVTVKIMAQDNAIISYPLVVDAGDYYVTGNIQITSTGSLEVYGTVTSGSYILVAPGGKLAIYSGGLVTAKTLEAQAGSFVDVKLGGELGISGGYYPADPDAIPESLAASSSVTEVKAVTVGNNRIYGEKGVIYAEFDGTREVAVYTPAGGLVKKQVAARIAQFNVPQGFYIVTVGGTAYKIFVPN